MTPEQTRAAAAEIAEAWIKRGTPDISLLPTALRSMKVSDDAMPLGFEASKADWNEAYAGRPMTERDWNSLTLGEQARYGAAECKTKGAIYSVHVNRNTVEISVSLPDSLALNGLTEDEAKWLEAALHNKIETTLHWIITARQNGWKFTR